MPELEPECLSIVCLLKMGMKKPRCVCIVVALVCYRFQIAYLAIIQGPRAIITCTVYRITFYVILDNVYAVRNIYNGSRNAVPFDSYMVEQFHFSLPPLCLLFCML